MDTITADVAVSDQLDRLVIRPRRREETSSLKERLRAANPRLDIHRTAEGLWIRSNAIQEMEPSLDSVDLRWSSEARLYFSNRRRVWNVRAEVISSIRRVLSNGVVPAKHQLADIKGIEALDDHQVINVAAMTIPNGFGLCVFDEQGAGKTVTGIFAFDTLAERGEADLLLIIAPKSMIVEWPRDFTKFKGELYNVQVITGDYGRKQRILTSGADVLITNYETVVSMERELRSRLGRYNGRAVLIVDESFFMKNPEAARTRALRRLREYCSRAYVLCGTPAPHSSRDLIEQFSFVDFGLTFSGLSVPKDPQAAIPIVQAAIDETALYIRNLKHDVLPELPSKSFQQVLVKLQPQQLAAYTSALENLIADLRDTTDGSFKTRIASFLARRSVLLQICSNPSMLIPGYTEQPAKILALDGLLHEVICQKREKVVLWSFYTASIDALVSRYEQYGCVRYDGTVSDVDMRRQAIERFQNDRKTMLFIGNPAAAGAGITLHRACFAIYESMSNQAAHYLQSLDRIHRRGQTKDVHYLILLCEGTIEIQEYERIRDRERSAQQLLGDHFQQPTTRTSMLSDALHALAQVR